MSLSKDTSPLEKHIGFWMRFVSNTVSYSFRDRIAKKGVTVAEWVALRALYDEGPCRLNALAEYMGTDPAAASRLVDRLLSKKLATRETSSEDRRSVKLTLTSKARALVPQLLAQADENDDFFFAPLSEADRAHLLRILKQLVSAHHLKQKPTE
jgi:DNA-binding MarR family transcriptional regulator